MSDIAINQLLSPDQAQVFRTPRLVAACEFLCGQQISGDGWPQYPGGRASLYHTALVISALGSTDFDHHAARISQAARGTFATFFGHTGGHKMSDLANLLRIRLAAPEEVEQTLSRQVCAELRVEIEKERHPPERTRVRELADAVGALAQTTVENRENVVVWAEQLLRYEDLRRGGWPGGHNGDPSILSTAAVVEALQAIDATKYAGAIQRGVRFLTAATTNGGWRRIGNGPDVFVQATVLRVLARSGALDNIENGIAALGDGESDAGGWGIAPGAPSAVEPTAAAVLALVACGENRVVPYRLAAAQVAEATKRITELEKEMAAAKRELEEGSARRNKRIIAQRDELQQRADLQQRELERLREESESARRAALEEAQRSRMLINYALREGDLYDSRGSSLLRVLEPALIFVFPIIAIALYVWGDFIAVRLGTEAGKLAALALLVGAMAFAATYQWRLIVRRRDYFARFSALQSVAKSADTPVSSVALTFADISSQMPPAIREEFAYILSSHIIDMPPEIGVDYGRDLLEKLDIPIRVREQTASWLKSLLSLDRYGRRAVIEQIRRQALRL
jgi:prenyltransferase beta subunit